MKKVIISIWIPLLFLLQSCVTDLDLDADGNVPPVLIKALSDIAILMNDSLNLTLKYVEAFDKDGDDLTIVAQTGENYILKGTTIIPDKDYIGDLFIKVQVFDGKNYSKEVTLIVSVVSTIELFPLIENSWWKYKDSIPASDTSLQSMIEVLGKEKLPVGNDTIEMSRLSWVNLNQTPFEYLMYSSDSGTVLYAGRSATDTMIVSQLLYFYPAAVGKSWYYKSLKYNITDGKFFLGDSATLSCTDTIVYIQVAAGIFECVEMSLKYTTEIDESISSSGVKLPSGTYSITEMLYYSPGVGYVKNETIVDGITVWIKELIDYHVEQKGGL